LRTVCIGDQNPDNDQTDLSPEIIIDSNSNSNFE